MAGEPFNLDQMRLVSLIDEQRSFSRAATALGISQSAVSQQVRGIEEALGRRLFRRGTAGIGPTADGDAYLVYARAMLRIGEDAKRHFGAPAAGGEIRLAVTPDGEAYLVYARAMLKVGGDARRHFSGPKVEGVIRLGLTEDFARTALPRVLALFSRAFPQFGFMVDCGLSSVLFSGLREGRYDIVVAKRLRHDGSGERLWSEPLAWYGREDIPPPVGEPLSLALIPAPSVSRQAMLDALRRAGRPWRVAFQSLSFGAIEAVVQAGIGISAFGQHFSAPGLVEIGDDGGLPPLGSVDICMEQANPAASEAVAAFCTLIRQAALLTAGHKPEAPTPADQPA